ncbi:hypothetical protein H7K23_17580 [Paracoccus yeei]|nr:hypothetical protein [Paracoccus yeei]
MSNRLPDLAFAAAAAALGIGIVFVFRSMYLAEDILPFAQEMTLIFLGAVVTIILTAALLNRQTDLELRKEGRVIILQQQCDIYMACIEKVAEIVETARHDAKLIDELRVLSHKLAVVASAGVVSSFEQVLESLQSGFADGTLSDGDGEGVMNAVADLTIAMRSDVLHAAAFPSQNTERAVRLNSRRMEQLDDLERHLLVSTDTREN